MSVRIRTDAAGAVAPRPGAQGKRLDAVLRAGQPTHGVFGAINWLMGGSETTPNLYRMVGHMRRVERFLSKDRYVVRFEFVQPPVPNGKKKLSGPVAGDIFSQLHSHAFIGSSTSITVEPDYNFVLKDSIHTAGDFQPSVMEFDFDVPAGEMSDPHYRFVLLRVLKMHEYENQKQLLRFLQQVDEEAPEYYKMYAAMRIWSGDESTTAYQLTIGFDRNVYAHRQGIEDYKRVKDVASDLLEFWGPLSKAIRDNNPDSRRLGDPHFVRVYSPVLFEKRPGLDRPGEVSIYFSVPYGSLDDPANRERLVVEMVKQVRR